MLNDAHRRLAYNAIDNARAIRKALAKRTRKGDRQRNQAIDRALRDIRLAMKPIRHEIARTQYEPNDSRYRQVILLLSDQLQRERRKLWKMRQKPKQTEDYVRDQIRRLLD